MTLYETKYNRKSELSIAQTCADAWGLVLRQTKSLCKFDAIFYSRGNGDIRRIAEIKDRSNSSSKYPTLIIDAVKVSAGMYITQFARDCEYTVIARFTDGIYFYDFDASDEFSSTLFCLNKPRDDYDVGDMVLHIPIDQMLKVAVRCVTT